MPRLRARSRRVGLVVHERDVDQVAHDRSGMCFPRVPLSGSRGARARRSRVPRRAAVDGIACSNSSSLGGASKCRGHPSCEWISIGIRAPGHQTGGRWCGPARDPRRPFRSRPPAAPRTRLARRRPAGRGRRKGDRSRDTAPRSPGPLTTSIRPGYAARARSRTATARSGMSWETRCSRTTHCGSSRPSADQRSAASGARRWTRTVSRSMRSSTRSTAAQISAFAGAAGSYSASAS